MISAKADLENGDHLVILGLSRENLKRLWAGMPIDIDCKKMGIDKIRIMIFAGDSEESIIRTFIDHGWVSKDTKIGRIEDVTDTP